MPNSKVTLRSYFNQLISFSCVLILGLFVAIPISNYYQEQAMPELTSIFLRNRMSTFLQEINSLYEENKEYAYFWGASEIESGLNTDVIDRLFIQANQRYHAINVGMRSVYPVVYTTFAQAVAEKLNSMKRQIPISFINVPVNKLTNQYLLTFGGSDFSEQISSFVSMQNRRLLKRNPNTFISSLARHYLFFDQSLNGPSFYLDRVYRRFLRREEEPDNEIFFSLWSKRIFYERPTWSKERRGTYSWNLPESEPEFQKYSDLKKDRKVALESYRIFERCCGMVTLDFNDGLLNEFVHFVNTIKLVSDQVVLYHIPEEQEFRHYRGPAAENEQRLLFSQLEERTGLKVRRFGEIEFESDDYIDFLHLSEKGQEKYYTWLFQFIR